MSEIADENLILLRDLSSVEHLGNKISKFLSSFSRLKRAEEKRRALRSLRSEQSFDIFLFHAGGQIRLIHKKDTLLAFFHLIDDSCGDLFIFSGKSP